MEKMLKYRTRVFVDSKETNNTKHRKWNEVSCFSRLNNGQGGKTVLSVSLRVQRVQTIKASKQAKVGMVIHL